MNFKKGKHYWGFRDRFGTAELLECVSEKGRFTMFATDRISDAAEYARIETAVLLPPNTATMANLVMDEINKGRKRN